MKRAAGAILTVFVLTGALLGCPLKLKNDDAPVDAGTISVTGTGAKNEAQITRYPNETSLGGAPALIANNGTVARTFPGAGTQVAVLAKGTPCGKMAQYASAGTLIMWTDTDGQNLMGWVPNASFQGGAVPASVKTVVIPKDAGPPAVADAGGAPAVADAGGNVSTNKADAGGAVVDICPVSCPPTAGKCPTGKINDSGMCRKPCKVTADCQRGVACNGKVCTNG